MMRAVSGLAMVLAACRPVLMPATDGDAATDAPTADARVGPSCAITVEGATQYSDLDEDTPIGIARGADGVTYTLALASDLTNGTQRYDLASVLPTGETGWARSFPGSAGGAGLVLASVASTDGAVILGGDFLTSVDLGGGPLTLGEGEGESFLVSIGPNSGTPEWVRTFPNLAMVSVAARGNTVCTTGSAGGTSVDLGGGPISTTTMAPTYVNCFDGAGAYLWGRRFEGGLPGAFGTGIAVDANGNVVLVGSVAGTLDLGDGEGLVNTGASDQPQTFVVSLAPGGAYRWSWRAAGLDAPRLAPVAMDDTGGTTFVGSCRDACTVDGVTFAPVRGSAEVWFALNVDGTGTVRWTRQFPNVSVLSHGIQVARSPDGWWVAIDAQSLIAGSTFVTDDGVSLRIPTYAVGTVLLRLTEEGQTCAAALVQGLGGGVISSASDGRLSVAGMFAGMVRAADVEFTSRGVEDAMVVRVAP